MRPRTKFIVVVGLLFVVFLVAEYRMPRKFSWNPTFAHTDPQPFGCMVFDSILSATMPQGYTVEQHTLWQIEHDTADTVLRAGTPAVPDSVVRAGTPALPTVSRRAFLIVADKDLSAIIPTAIRLAEKGNTVIVATSYLHQWADTLGIDFHFNNYFNIAAISGKAVEKGSLHWHDGTPRQWPVYNQMIGHTLAIPDSVDCEVLATLTETYNPSTNIHGDSLPSLRTLVVAAAFPMRSAGVPARTTEPGTVDIPARNRLSAVGSAGVPARTTEPGTAGDGELILVSAPLLLTNYMMLSGDGHEFIACLMNRVAHLPVIRIESYMSGTSQEQSPLYVLLREPPLRWAVYLSALTVLLFCIFTARRRQRAIPVITKPRNGNLEFVKLIGTLAWQQHDNAALLTRKITFTAEELRNQTGIDISTAISGSATTSNSAATSGSATTSSSTFSSAAALPVISQLAAHTGRDPEELRFLLHNIHLAANGIIPLSDQELKTYIDELDQLLQS